MLIERSITYLSTSDARQAADLGRLTAGRRPGDPAGGQHDGELLADVAVAGAEDPAPGIGSRAGMPCRGHGSLATRSGTTPRCGCNEPRTATTRRAAPSDATTSRAPRWQNAKRATPGSWSWTARRKRRSRWRNWRRAPGPALTWSSTWAGYCPAPAWTRKKPRRCWKTWPTGRCAQSSSRSSAWKHPRHPRRQAP